MSKPTMTREKYLAAIKLLPADWYQRQHVESLAADLERAERERDEARELLREWRLRLSPLPDEDAFVHYRPLLDATDALLAREGEG